LLIVVEVYLSLVPLGGTPRFEHADKVAHFLMHAVNLCVVAVAFPSQTLFRRMLIPLLLLGPAIEIMQHFSPPREASFLDGLANLAGLAAAYLFASRCLRPWLHQFARAA
jgi:VanZ family protein